MFVTHRFARTVCEMNKELQQLTTPDETLAMEWRSASPGTHHNTQCRPSHEKLRGSGHTSSTSGQQWLPFRYNPHRPPTRQSLRIKRKGSPCRRQGSLRAIGDASHGHNQALLSTRSTLPATPRPPSPSRPCSVAPTRVRKRFASCHSEASRRIAYTDAGRTDEARRTAYQVIIQGPNPFG